SEHFEVGFNLAQLAALCQLRGRLGEASRLYERGLRILRGILGPRHAVLAAPLANLASLRVAQGRPSEAMAFYRTSLRILRARMSASPPHTMACAAAYEKLVRTQARGDRRR